MINNSCAIHTFSFHNYLDLLRETKINAHCDGESSVNFLRCQIKIILQRDEGKIGEAMLVYCSVYFELFLRGTHGSFDTLGKLPFCAINDLKPSSVFIKEQGLGKSLQNTCEG